MSGQWTNTLPLLVLMTSLLAGVFIFMAGEERQRLRTVLNLTAAVLKLVLIGVIAWAVLAGLPTEFRLPLLPGLDLVLRSDALSLLFSTLSAVLWLLTTVYAIAYLERSRHRARFFGFFSLCVAATMGVASAGNLFTFFIFYELLTLSTWPLVAHKGSSEAIASGRTYLKYTLGGSALLLAGIIWLYGLSGPRDFAAGGGLHGLGAEHPHALGIIFVLLMAGFAVKAAMVPLHAWLPRAMVAPAPVSALLHAVAVVKAGAFGLIRLVYDVFGPDLARALGMADLLAAAAAVTIIYGSVLALRQTDIKLRLAYSTVSQVSYIGLGIATGGSVAAVGGLVHLVHQGLMKITLFFCAGIYSEMLGVRTIDRLDGIGRRMPWTGMSFTVGALGMLGVPPLAGFVSKWYLGAGAMAEGRPWVVAVLVASTLLNAAYFLPLLHRMWFRPAPKAWPRQARLSRLIVAGLVLPTVAVALLALGVGLLAGLPLSPLDWVTVILREYYE